ncbi:MAG: adenosylcobinamide amidohydrolase [Methanolinea sp.]|nr:adenosylcobinamide amidohydrolase [Methanolinea sp.]
MLILRGRFRAASTSVAGGLGQVSTILAHTLGQQGDMSDPLHGLERVLHREGLPPDFFGLCARVQMADLCVLQYDGITVFVTAGASEGDADAHVSVSLIIYSREGMTDAALLETIMTGTAARVEALYALGRPSTGTPSDAVIVACEGEVQHRNAGTLTEIGSKVRSAVLFGIPEALGRNEGRILRQRPSFFIFSRYQGDHWVEWLPRECPYYPCHFPGQRCDFCYCPFYPCGDESLGQWVKSASKNGMVWNCSGCTLLHEPLMADYLLAHPEAPLAELKRKRTGQE